MIFGLGAIVLAYCGYQIANIVVSAHRAGIDVQTVSTKARTCAEDPTSQCFIELALLNMPLHRKTEANGSVQTTLRYFGYGDVVDTRFNVGNREFFNANRDAQLLYDAVKTDPKKFITEPPISHFHTYGQAFRLLRRGPKWGYSRNSLIDRAEDTAHQRENLGAGCDKTTPLLQSWRAGLEAYANNGFHWLRFAEISRECGRLKEAGEALAKANELGLFPANNLTAIVETFRVFGASTAYYEIERFEKTMLRAEAYLRISYEVQKSGDSELALDAFDRFEINYDSSEAILRERVRLSSRAARLASSLGSDKRAEHWADVYARATRFYSIPDRVHYSGRLYADIGLFKKSLAVARDAIEHVAPLESSRWSAPEYKSASKSYKHFLTMGRAIGLLCRAGEYIDAFAYAAENANYGRNAVGCLTAIQNDNAMSRLSEIEDRLGPYSLRPIRTEYAKSLVESGSYIEAAEIITNTLDLPPSFVNYPRAFDNFDLLKLAIAMHNEPLTKKVLSHIANDRDGIAADSAVRFYAKVAAYLAHWPDHRPSGKF